MTLFKFHLIVIFMYTAIIWVVLWEIPYRYDRIKKSKAERRKLRKKRQTKAKRKVAKI